MLISTPHFSTYFNRKLRKLIVDAVQCKYDKSASKSGGDMSPVYFETEFNEMIENASDEIVLAVKVLHEFESFQPRMKKFLSVPRI